MFEISICNSVFASETNLFVKLERHLVVVLKINVIQ